MSAINPTASGCGGVFDLGEFFGDDRWAMTTLLHGVVRALKVWKILPAVRSLPARNWMSFDEKNVDARNCRGSWSSCRSAAS